jgi:hypothetical protein
MHLIVIGLLYNGGPIIFIIKFIVRTLYACNILKKVKLIYFKYFIVKIKDHYFNIAYFPTS